MAGSIRCVFLLLIYSLVSTKSQAVANLLLAPSYLGSAFDNDSRQPFPGQGLPWSAVGKLTLPDGKWCTATLVGENLILTAAHCILRHGKYIGLSAKFHPAFSGGSVGVLRFQWGTSYPEQEWGKDWALGTLEKPIGEELGFLRIRNITGEALLLSKASLLPAFHSDFENGKIPSQQIGILFSHFLPAVGVVGHNGSTSGGSSGGAFLGGPPGMEEVVALNVAERLDANGNSQRGIPFSEWNANRAIPSAAFFDNYLEILSSKGER